MAMIIAYSGWFPFVRSCELLVHPSPLCLFFLILSPQLPKKQKFKMKVLVLV